LLDIDQKIILLDHQNNFVGILKIMSNAAKNFDIRATSLSVLHNYFDSSTKFFYLYPVKILDLSVKFFCIIIFLIALIFFNPILDTKLCYFLYYYSCEISYKFKYSYEKHISMHFIGKKVSTQ